MAQPELEHNQSSASEQRPFSPPFTSAKNEEPTSSAVKVKKSSILRDSLENPLPPKKIALTSETDGNKVSVENEEGETVEVLFDPILKCYYDPKSNTYYELK